MDATNLISNANLGIGNKYINTPSILIEKNMMMWDKHTMIQLSNISYLSAEKLQPAAFPIGAVLMIFLGFILLAVQAELVLLNLVIWTLSGLYIYLWYKETQRREKGAILHIKMNSGNNLNFEFEDKEFLWCVAETIQNIMINGGASEQVEINIVNSVIRDSSVLTGTSINGN